MQQSCSVCQQTFVIPELDMAFYEKVSPGFNGQTCQIPPPDACPDCRQKRRLRFRNERNLYGRNCDRCQKEIIAVYPKGTTYPVYCPECWWSDGWDAMNYGLDINWQQEPLEHCRTLLQSVPVLSLININSENSTYAHDAENNKNCYLVFSTINSEDSLYVTTSSNMRNCVDCYWSSDSELCYELIFSKNCYQSFFSNYCAELNFSYFCNDCDNCNYCFGCFSLKNKEYHIFNKPYTKEEYTQKIASFIANMSTWAGLEKTKKAVQTFWSKKAHIYANLTHCDCCTGDTLVNCKNCRECFSTINAEDCAYLYDTINLKDAYDCNLASNGELLYNCQSCLGTMNICSSFSAHCHNIFYCHHCFHSNNCFGCVGLHHKAYCIFNKQYTKEEYETLVPQLIAHMKGAWGTFFPCDMSQVDEKDSVLRYYFPAENEKSIDALLAEITVYPLISDAKINCLTCHRDYLIVKQEQEFYTRHKLSRPLICSTCRHKRRIQQQNPYKLYQRNCAQCQNPITSIFAPENPIIVYCNQCYSKERG